MRVGGYIVKVGLVLLVLVCCPGLAAAAERVALVIGNAAYERAPALANPANDAAEIAAALEEVGFETATLLDADFETLRRGLDRFRRRAAEAEIAVLYFAGHGMEWRQRNYLMPVDADVTAPGDIPFHAMPLDFFRRTVRPASRLSVVILDACRNNPFAERMIAEAGTRSADLGLGRGLTLVTGIDDNEIVAYAARAGTVAADGAGRNSPYAEALAAALRTPGLEIGKLFRQVRDDVLAKTAGRQEPAHYASLSAADLFLRPPEPGPAPDPAPGVPDRAAIEAAFVAAIADSDDPRDYRDYLDRFPEGIFAPVARRRLAALEAAAAAVAEAPSDPPGQAPERPDEGAADGALDPEQLAILRPGGGAEPRDAPPAAPPPDPAPDAGDTDLDATEIRAIQARLAVLNLYDGPLDGRLSEGLAEAIRLYEGRGRGPVTGEATRALHDALQERVPERWVRRRFPDPAADPGPDPAPEPPAAAPAEPAEPELRLGRAALRALQARLAILGHDPGPLDGLLGQRTRAALAAFQRAEDLPAEGRLTRPTLAALESKVSEARVAARLAPEPEPQAPEASAAEPEDPAGVRVQPLVPTTGYVVRATSFRAAPAFSSDRLARIAKGTRVAMIGSVPGSSWLQVLWNGRTGFLRASNLSVEPPAPAPPAAVQDDAVQDDAGTDFVPFGSDGRGGDGGGPGGVN